MVRVQTGFRIGLAAAALAMLSAGPVRAQYVGKVDDQKQQGARLRSTAVLEYTGTDLKDMKQSRLVPIAIWDGAQFQPGGLYLAQPAPLAVLSGTQYELQDSGKPAGFFNIRDAEDLAGLWIGVGTYEALPKPKPKAPPSKANHVYQVKDADPDKPHFAHRPDDEQPKPSDAGAAPAPASGAGGSPAKAAPPVDPDRPTLHPRSGSDSGSGDNSGSGTPAASSGSNSSDDSDRPTFHRQSNASTETPTAQPIVDPNRPHLEYKQPTEQEKIDKAEALSGLPVEMNQIAGVSDSRPGDSLSWQFSWANADDQAKMKAALEELAQKAMAPPATPTPAPARVPVSGTARRKAHQPPPPPLPMLADEQFKAYSLSFGGGATMVLTAHSAGSPAKYVTIIAAPDFYGNPKVLLQQVTSDDGLDVSPRYRLVDAVDTEGNGRADLIFELRGRTYRQFAIYRIADGAAMQAFVTQPTAAN